MEEKETLGITTFSLAKNILQTKKLYTKYIP